MYSIIGGDQKEYGPVTEEQLRLWIAEGRVNAQTSVRIEGTTEWRPLADFPEFAGSLRPKSAGASAAAAAGGTVVVPPEVVLGRDYSLDIGNCITRSWELVKQNLGPMVGITTMVMVVMLVINQVVGLLSQSAITTIITEHRVSAGGIAMIFLASLITTPVYVVLTAGLLKYYLKLIRGERAGIADAFAGFGSAIGQLVLLGLVSGFLSLIGYCLCILPGVYLTVSWMFAVPFVIDRRMGFWEAMEFSRRVVAKHWFLMFALQLVCGLLAVCGLVACCIGILVSMPFGTATLMYAYEDICGRQTA
jgi:GYF domain 2